VYVAPLTVDTLAELAAITRALMVGTAEELIWFDLPWPSETTFDVTFVILPPEIVTVTVADPYRYVAVAPVYVPSLYAPVLELVVEPVDLVPVVVVVPVTASPVVRVAPFAVPTAHPAPRTPTDAITAATLP
jgi:hypothetical protein